MKAWFVAMKAWFVPPIVIPVGILLMVVAYVAIRAHT